MADMISLISFVLFHFISEFFSIFVVMINVNKIEIEISCKIIFLPIIFIYQLNLLYPSHSHLVKTKGLDKMDTIL